MDRITTCVFFKSTSLILVNLKVRSVTSGCTFYQLPLDKENTVGIISCFFLLILLSLAIK